MQSEDMPAECQLRHDRYFHPVMLLQHSQSAFNAHRHPGGWVWVEYVSPESNLSPNPSTYDVTLFVKKVFADVIKLG